MHFLQLMKRLDIKLVKERQWCIGEKECINCIMTTDPFIVLLYVDTDRLIITKRSDKAVTKYSAIIGGLFVNISLNLCNLG